MLVNLFVTTAIKTVNLLEGHCTSGHVWCKNNLLAGRKNRRFLEESPGNMFSFYLYVIFALFMDIVAG